MKIEIYFDEEKDAVIMVQDGVLKYHDNGVNSSEWFCYFNIDEAGEFDKITAEEILEGYDCLQADFRYHCSPPEVEEYFEHVRNSKITGKLITTKYTN